jgi:hypothetical protein
LGTLVPPSTSILHSPVDPYKNLFPLHFYSIPNPHTPSGQKASPFCVLGRFPPPSTSILHSPFRTRESPRRVISARARDVAVRGVPVHRARPWAVYPHAEMAQDVIGSLRDRGRQQANDRRAGARRVRLLARLRCSAATKVSMGAACGRVAASKVSRHRVRFNLP